MRVDHGTRERSPPAGTAARKPSMAVTDQGSASLRLSRGLGARRGRGRQCRTPRTKQAAASAAASASSGAVDRNDRSSGPIAADRDAAGSAWKVSHSETKPFNGGRAGDRGAADQEGERRCFGMRWISPPMMLHVALAGGVQHRAGAEEQQALEHRVVEHVEQRRGERQVRQPPATHWRRTPAPAPGR